MAAGDSREKLPVKSSHTHTYTHTPTHTHLHTHTYTHVHKALRLKPGAALFFF